MLQIRTLTITHIPFNKFIILSGEREKENKDERVSNGGTAMTPKGTFKFK